MIRLNVRFLLTVLLCVFSAVVFGQYKTKDYLIPKVTLNYDDHKVVAYVKPVKIFGVFPDRQYHWVTGNQINVTQGGYSGKLLNGLYKDFYMNKNLKEAGSFNTGLKTGKWKSWTSDGVLKDEYKWRSGQKDGRYLKYDSLGRLAEKGRYKNDQLNGKQVTFVGDSLKVVFFEKGKIIERKRIVPAFIRKLFTKKTSVK